MTGPVAPPPGLEDATNTNVVDLVPREVQELTAEFNEAVVPPPGLELPSMVKIDSSVSPPSPPCLSGVKDKAPEGTPFLGAFGWNSSQADSSTCTVWQVSINGLPNKLLSHAMIQAMLQQAGFDAECFSSFSSHTGKPCGEVVVNFLSWQAAELCVHHFHGCQWDPSGTMVKAEILTKEKPMMKPKQKKNSGVQFSIEAPEFQTFVC